MRWLNVGCGPHRAPEPWVNLDCQSDEVVRPDVIVDGTCPLAGFDDGTAERIYLGHVLEHIAWQDVPRFLVEVHRVIAADGEVMVVGPDAHRTLQRWRAGLEPWSQVCSVLEDGSHYQPSPEQWPQARHHWNCHEARVVGLLEAARFTVESIPIEATARFDGWPVVSNAPWQFAVSARPAAA